MSLDSSSIQAALQPIADDKDLLNESSFDRRADAIDVIDFHILDRIEGLRRHAPLTEELASFKQRAENLKAVFENIDSHLFKELRENIRNGLNPGFMTILHKYFGDAITQEQPVVVGYDNLDLFINRLVTDQPAPEATLIPEPEMVFYQKVPARIVLAMVARANPKAGDVFTDIGSGLGQAAILVNLISGIPAIGIEYQPVYCNYAEASATALGLSRVEFVNTDARIADYSTSTIFFMYTPFRGKMMEDVLAIIKKESLKRALRIFTFGPCSAAIAQHEWLSHEFGDPHNPDSLCGFIAKSLSK